MPPGSEGVVSLNRSSPRAATLGEVGGETGGIDCRCDGGAVKNAAKNVAEQAKTGRCLGSLDRISPLRESIRRDRCLRQILVIVVGSWSGPVPPAHGSLRYHIGRSYLEGSGFGEE